MEKLLQVTYRSTLKENDLVEIISGSFTRNKENNIGGVIFVSNKDIIQTIEGFDFDIIKLYSKIEKDSRHYDVMLLDVHEVSERHFQKWKMQIQPKTRKEFKEYISKTSEYDTSTYNILKDCFVKNKFSYNSLSQPIVYS